MSSLLPPSSGGPGNFSIDQKHKDTFEVGENKSSKAEASNPNQVSIDFESQDMSNV